MKLDGAAFKKLEGLCVYSTDFLPLLKDMRTGTFVSHVGLILRMDIHPKHAQPPGDAQIIKRDTLAHTLGSILRQDMTRAQRRCTSPSSRPCDGVGQNS